MTDYKPLYSKGEEPQQKWVVCHKRKEEGVANTQRTTVVNTKHPRMNLTYIDKL